MKRIVSLFLVFLIVACAHSLQAECTGTRAVKDLLDRISPSLSTRLTVEIDCQQSGDPADSDWFEIHQSPDGPAVRGNNAISVAAGINWYLKYVAGVHLTWGNMKADLPEVLPSVKNPIRKSTSLLARYYLNYCTYSYSMAFWDWERWQQEIDWMALHGINMPLAITGMGTVWRNVLRELGYPQEAINGFIAGPGFRAWWLMNNLEGWGGPNSHADYEREAKLQRQILERMRQLGMEPLAAGYSGMLPHDSGEILGVELADPGKWLGYTRPAFLQPTDKDFDRIADIYYDELHKLYGQVKYFSMDPFHEGGNTDGIDLAASGRKIMDAMKRANSEAVWVIQGWQENPRREMIDSLPRGSMIVLDLQSENSPSSRVIGDYGKHDWLFCMLLNFGGNVGLYGKMTALTEGFGYSRLSSPTLRGVGLTMEGIENNPVMYELLCELPWRQEKVDPDEWVAGYATARYGIENPDAVEAWRILARSVYDCPRDSIQQGTIESLFCARPSDRPQTASAWAASKNYYAHSDLLEAARLLAEAAPALRNNPNYRYDLVDITRQAVADRGREVASRITDALRRGDRDAYRLESQQFLSLIDMQDSLLATMPEFRLGSWIEAARNCAIDPADRDRWEWNARTQITTWGDREASDRGRLHDYANREWQGLLKDFYRPRWQQWFDYRLENWNAESQPTPDIDFFDMERRWAESHNPYSPTPEGDPVDTAVATLSRLVGR